MRKIQMVDLVSQYDAIKEEVNESVQGIMERAAFINGPEVSMFAGNLAEYLGAKHVIPCANGTDALQIAMMGLGLKPGDEVITASFTYVATAEVIALLQLTPVLVDVDTKTFCLDPDAVRKAITPKTKAIVPVHLFGQSADMDAIMEIARENNLKVVEDTAQAIGADYTFKDGRTQNVGTIGDIGCTSFFPSKNLGCYGDGGAMFTNDDDLATALKQISNHGQSVRYYHDRVGVNSRLDTIQAAVLDIKLRKLNDYTAARQAAADYYDQAFAEVDQLETPFRDPRSTHVFHQYTLKGCGFDRFAMQEYLKSQDIPCMVYYPVALHMQKAYKDDRYNEGDFPVTEQLCSCVFSLPMHSELDKEQQDYIIDHVKEFIKNNSK